MTKIMHEMLAAIYENEARGSVVLDDEVQEALDELVKRKLIHNLWKHLEDSGSDTLDVVSFDLTEAGSWMILRLEGLLAVELG